MAVPAIVAAGVGGFTSPNPSTGVPAQPAILYGVIVYVTLKTPVVVLPSALGIVAVVVKAV